jgi:hypothetical protein
VSSVGGGICATVGGRAAIIDQKRVEEIFFEQRLRERERDQKMSKKRDGEEATDEEIRQH